MRFISQDPDLETIFRRIEDEDYDLQPDFQRGEVWPQQKKRRLIDSILRGWHIPPVHLVARDDNRSDVLDGQQRLTAIRDFMNGQFTVDGNTEPQDARIVDLHGLRYEKLPAEVARSFRKFTIRVFELVDFMPEEPHELFFRLNQPTSLTEAEKRNAFAGDARDQVREIVEWAVLEGFLSEHLGFSNARLAYHDMVARVLVTVETENLGSKVTASRVTARYRSGEPFSAEVVGAVKAAIEDAVLPILIDSLRPNKATLHSWFCAGAQMRLDPGLDETIRQSLPTIVTMLERERWVKRQSETDFDSRVVALFQDRSTARVADASSVMLRDMIVWMFIARERLGASSQKLSIARDAWDLVPEADDLDEALLAFALENSWGELGWA